MTTKGQIQNPILRGFNPDPSIIRVDEDYYIATSTFEWFPGVQIHHSRDLINWELITRPLDRISQLDLVGVPDSCGVWAPCLSYKDGTYYLIYSNVRSFDGQWKDTPNYLVTATDIRGPWSEPVFLNSSGFDPSLFHDDDGRSYLLNMLMDHRDNLFFGGIILQELNTETLLLTGDIHYLFSGTDHGRTEGPHLYKRNGYYYLVLAEGGTSYEHCMTMLRSKMLTGPYELHADNPFITAKYSPENYLQKTGHGDLVETQDGDWYAVFLTGRPLSQLGRCTLGRESAIVPVTWKEDDWLYHQSDTKAAARSYKAPACSTDIEPHRDNSRRIEFSENTPLDIQLQALRAPIKDDWASLTERPGFLRIKGRDSLSSTFYQSLLAHRLQAHHAEASTCLEFSPDNFQQMAGLVCYYNTSHYHYLHIRGNDFGSSDKRKFLTITSCDKYQTSEPVNSGIEVTACDKLWLKADFQFDKIQFYYATDSIDGMMQWQVIGPELDGSILSDDYVENSEVRFHPCFTGAFMGICCQDLSGQNKFADFAWFNYQEIASL